MSIVVFIILISTLALVHEFGHFITAKLSNVKVEEFGIGFPPRLFGYRYKETLYSINLLPIGGFVRLLGENSEQVAVNDPRAFCNRPRYQQAGMLLAGVTMNLIVGVIILAVVFTRFGVPQLKLSLKLGEIRPESPASEAGLVVGEEITGYVLEEDEIIDIYLPGDFQELIQNNIGQEISLLVRSGEEANTDEVRIVKVKLRSEFTQEEGALGIVYTIQSLVTYRQIPLLKVPREAFNQTTQMMGMLFGNIGQLFLKMFTGQRVPEGVAGPVGIARISGEVAKEGWAALLHFAGILSISLAGFNILPLPALDGGRLLLVIYEAVSRRRIEARLQRWINTAGLVFIFALLAWVTFWDIAGLF